jgi:hypothetical protein
MILAAIFEILFCFLAEMLMTAVVVLATGAFTLVIELASYLVASGLIEGTLTLLVRLVDVGLASSARALRAVWEVLR